ncbi:olfactory receptor 8H1-like [Xenopus laevis]|uniref:Olfactory receptor n=1 Tax=Xenopus laevis TaxID=8355 RepID=A0A8J1MIF3_XENLA|nr:olfactory receptor 8H1-like [Xenopus laevis]
MENQTQSKRLYFLAFDNNGEKQALISIIFFFIYVTGVLGNLVIINVIYLDIHLHTPMYFFLCTLAFVDICYPTVTLPKLIDILLSGNNSITFIQCFTQMYFFLALAAVEVILLSSMAYDRYLAICKPLRYHCFMHRRACVLVIIGTWISGFTNSALFISLVSKLTICHSNRIKQFFCDIKAVADISCDRTTFYNTIYVEAFSVGLMTFSLNVISYINIIRTILHIKSKHGRQKAFSTCTSHFTVLIIFYGSAFWMYMRPPSESESLDPVFSVFYVAVTPMLNPLIYSLRNKEVKNALIKSVRKISA